MHEIPELSEYNNSLIVISDSTDHIGFRSGARYSNQSRAREELFYVAEKGKIIGDIAWTFSNYTDLTAYPAETSYLTVEGGTFYLSGNPPVNGKSSYLQNGFSITRSRTIIKNQWVGLENGKSDVSMISPKTANSSDRFLTVFQFTAGDTKPFPVSYYETPVSYVVFLSDRVVSMRVPVFSAGKIRSLLILKILTWRSHCRGLPGRYRI